MDLPFVFGRFTAGIPGHDFGENTKKKHLNYSFSHIKRIYSDVVVLIQFSVGKECDIETNSYRLAHPYITPFENNIINTVSKDIRLKLLIEIDIQFRFASTIIHVLV